MINYLIYHNILKYILLYIIYRDSLLKSPQSLQRALSQSDCIYPYIYLYVYLVSLPSLKYKSSMAHHQVPTDQRRWFLAGVSRQSWYETIQGWGIQRNLLQKSPILTHFGGQLRQTFMSWRSVFHMEIHHKMGVALHIWASASCIAHRATHRSDQQRDSPPFRDMFRLAGWTLHFREFCWRGEFCRKIAMLVKIPIAMLVKSTVSLGEVSMCYW